MKAENIKKLCEVLKIERTTNIEKIAEEIIDPLNPGLKEIDTQAYKNTHLLMTSLLCYFAEFVDPSNYTLEEFEKVGRKTGTDFPGERNLLSFNSVLEKVAKEKPESECGRYYKEFVAQPTKLRPSQIMMHFFFDYTDYLDWVEGKVFAS